MKGEDADVLFVILWVSCLCMHALSEEQSF